jgi:hypothetical protein
MTSYSPICHSFATIVFKDLHKLNLLPGGDMKVVREAHVDCAGLRDYYRVIGEC